MGSQTAATRSAPLTISDAFTQVWTEIRAKEARAIRQGKRPVWLYVRHMEEQFSRIDYRLYPLKYEPRDKVLTDLIRERLLQADADTRRAEFDPSLKHLEHAVYSDALGVYLIKVLRLAGHVVPNRSLAWLQAQRRWTEDGQPLEQEKTA